MKRSSLFDVPVWVDNFPDVVEHHAEMIDEVEAAIDQAQGTPRDVLAHQTIGDPCGLPSKGWRLLDERMQACLGGLIRAEFARWRFGEMHLRRWALRTGKLDENEKAKLLSDGLHNHLPALLSCIYYLSLPSEMPTEERGTEFHNPYAGIMDLISPRTTIIDPRVGDFVVFPSFVDHRPLGGGWNTEGAGRIIVSADAYFITGRGRPPMPIG